MDDLIYKCVLISICFTGLSFNLAVLFWKFCRRKWNQINTFFTINLTATNILSSMFLMVLSVNATIDFIQPTNDDHVKIQNKNLCKVATFIQSFAYEAKLGFLFLKCIDMTKCVRNTSSAKGFSTNKILAFAISIWFLSIAAAVVQFIPVPYFQNELDIEQVPGELCSHIENLHNETAGWEYSFGLHVGLNGFLYFGTQTNVGRKFINCLILCPFILKCVI